MNKPLRILLLLVAASVLHTSRAEAHEGWGIVVDASGRVYFGDIPANTIWRLSEQGRVERVALGKHSHALTLDSAGNLYGTNPHLTLPIRSVWRLAPNGHLTDVISPTENFPLGLQSFIMDGAGNMYSVNARNAQTPEMLLLKRSHEGEIITLAGSTVGHADGTGSKAKFMGIDGTAWGPNGVLYLTDGPYVRRVAVDGTVTTLGAGPLTDRKWDEDLLGIAVDAGGNVYVADHANRRILKVTAAGAVSTVVRTGLLWTPTGITVARDELYVLEHLRMPLAILGDLAVGPYMRIRKVSADGNVSELARIWGRHSFDAAGVAAAIVGVIVGAKYLSSRKTMRTKLLLFGTAVILGGLGGALGSIVGNSFGKTGLFAGGIIGGLLAAVATGQIAAGRRWIAPHSWRGVAIGTAVGFLVAAGIATRSLSSPVGPILSTILIGVGALLGARLTAKTK